MNKIFLQVLVASLACNEALGGGNFGVQIVAEFPPGVWESDCSAKSLRRLPERCHSALGQNSTKGQQLACALLSAPGTNKRLPLGMFPTSLPLGTDISSLPSSALTKIFEDCALPKMIEEGCVTFVRNVWGGEYLSESYVTSSDYASTISESFSIDTSASAGFGPVSISASINQKNEQASSLHVAKETSGLTQAWRNDIGTVSFSQCANDYIADDITKEWKKFADNKDSLSALDMAKDPEFSKVAEKGFYYPVSFGFSVQYRSAVDAIYESKESTSSSLMSQAVTAGIEASFLGAHVGSSVTVSNAISQSDAAKSVNAKVEAKDSSVGECDFPAVLANGGADWANVLAACAEAAADDIANLPRPAYITRGGFRSLTKYLSTQNVEINSPALNAALLALYGYCKLDNAFYKAPEVSTHYKCYFANGEEAYRVGYNEFEDDENTLKWVDGSSSKTYPDKIGASWKLIHDAFYDSPEARSLMESKLCGSECKQRKV